MLRSTSSGYGWGAGETIVHTEDGGATWAVQPANVFRFATAVSFVGADGVVLTTSDGGDTWVNRQNGSPREALGMAALDGRYAWASTIFGEDTCVARTTNGGATRTREDLPGNPENITSLQFATANRGWAAGLGTFLRTAE